MRSAGIALLLVCTLAGCKKEDPAALQAARMAQLEQSAAAPFKVYEDAMAARNWELARAQADMITTQFAGTTAAAKVAQGYGELAKNADAAREERRLKGLWDYVVDGAQRHAMIQSKEPIELDGGNTRVQLTFRDHPEWGRSSYLVLKRGDFNCYKGCTLKLMVDGRARTLPGSRPKTDDAIAMFIDDQKAMWRIAKSAKEVRIEFPVKPSGTRTAVFETGGLDAMQMPKWN